MKATRPRRPGFALNRKSYIDLLKSFMWAPMRSYFRQQVAFADDARADPLFENELRRLVELQLAGWVSVAGTNGRFDRGRAIEEAIGEVKQRADRLWTIAVNGRARHKKADPSTLSLPNQQQVEAAFFSQVRTACVAALQSPGAERLLAPPEDIYDIWRFSAGALTYYFQLEIARVNNNLTYVMWFAHRVREFLDAVSYSIDVGDGPKIDLVTAKVGIELVPVDRVWKFAIDEIALQLAIPGDELLQPNRQALEAAFFAKLDEIVRYPAEYRSRRDELNYAGDPSIVL
jgi:hypothetical protein